MGADMMLAVCEVPNDIDAARRRIPELSDRVIRLAHDYQWGEEADAIDDEMRAAVTEVLNQALDSIEEGWRDQTWIHIQNRNYVSTGGLSWGDPPSDSYPLIGLLDFVDSETKFLNTDSAGRRE